MCIRDSVFRGTPFRDNFDKIASSHLVTNKLMRREFIEQHCCRFRCYDIGEDAMFFIDFYRNDPACLVSLRKVCYHYTESRVGSLSNSYHNERIDENFYISDALRDVYGVRGSIVQVQGQSLVLLSLIHI